jgi:hypothetical protein
VDNDEAKKLKEELQTAKQHLQQVRFSFSDLAWVFR